MKRISLLAVLLLTSWAGVSYAQGTWGDIATVSETTTGHLCAYDVDGNSDDQIDCNELMPFVDTSGNVSVTGTTTTSALELSGVAGGSGISQTVSGGTDNLGDHTATQALDMGGFNVINAGGVSATHLEGDGSLITNIPASAITGMSADNIVSGTTNVTAYENTSITFTTAGSQRMVVDEQGNIGIGTTTPTKALTVSGTTLTDALELEGVAGGSGISQTVSGGMDNLGDHTATQDLDLGGNNIIAAANVSVTGHLVVEDTFQVSPYNNDCSNPAHRGRIRVNPTTNKMQICN